jgi:dTDP-4-dehydrorhamnose reductase
MKVLIYGSKGWIGKQLVELFKAHNITYYIGKSRLENYENLLCELKDKKQILNITHVISATGRTHGIYNDIAYNTIDYLEMPGKLRDNMRDNYVGPVNLAEITDKMGIHYTYFGTGCIFTYDNVHTIDNQVGFTEEDNPNFFGSSYSIIKGHTDIKMKQFKNTLNLRIRMPIIGKHHTRNFITKITNYEKICSIPNSMTILDELLPIILHMMENNVNGTYNMTNPGIIEHNEILELYKNYIDNLLLWTNFDIIEQSNILKSARSNNFLNTDKLEDYCRKHSISVMNIKKGIIQLLKKWKV